MDALLLPTFIDLVKNSKPLSSPHQRVRMPLNSLIKKIAAIMAMNTMKADLYNQA